MILKISLCNRKRVIGKKAREERVHFENQQKKLKTNNQCTKTEEPQSTMQQENTYNYGEQSGNDIEETTLVVCRVPIRRNRKYRSIIFLHIYSIYCCKDGLTEIYIL